MRLILILAAIFAAESLEAAGWDGRFFPTDKGLPRTREITNNVTNIVFQQHVVITSLVAAIDERWLAINFTNWPDAWIANNPEYTIRKPEQALEKCRKGIKDLIFAGNWFNVSVLTSNTADGSVLNSGNSYTRSNLIIAVNALIEADDPESETDPSRREIIPFDYFDPQLSITIDGIPQSYLPVRNLMGYSTNRQDIGTKYGFLPMSYMLTLLSHKFENNGVLGGTASEQSQFFSAQVVWPETGPPPCTGGECGEQNTTSTVDLATVNINGYGGAVYGSESIFVSEFLSSISQLEPPPLSSLENGWIEGEKIASGFYGNYGALIGPLDTENPLTLNTNHTAQFWASFPRYGGLVDNTNKLKSFYFDCDPSLNWDATNLWFRANDIASTRYVSPVFPETGLQYVFVRSGSLIQGGFPCDTCDFRIWQIYEQDDPGPRETCLGVGQEYIAARAYQTQNDFSRDVISIIEYGFYHK